MSLCACVILKRTGKQTKIYGAASYQARLYTTSHISLLYKAGPHVYGGSWGSTENGALTPLGRMEKPEALPIDRGMRGNYNTHAMYIVQYILPYLHLYGKERLKWHPETNLRGTKW